MQKEEEPFGSAETTPCCAAGSELHYAPGSSAARRRPLHPAQANFGATLNADTPELSMDVIHRGIGDFAKGKKYSSRRHSLLLRYTARNRGRMTLQSTTLTVLGFPNVSIS